MSCTHLNGVKWGCDFHCGPDEEGNIVIVLACPFHGHIDMSQPIGGIKTADDIAFENILRRDLARAKRQVSEAQRKGERRARHIIGLTDKNDALCHELDRLERVLAWVYKTNAPDYKDVIARTIPNR